MAAAENPDINPDVRAVLAHDLRFSNEDFAKLERNNVVGHGLDAGAAGEVALAGAVLVHASKAEFFARVRDIARFKQSPDVMQIGRFSNPPTSGDLALLTVDRDDFDVRNCRVGDCGSGCPPRDSRFERRSTRGAGAGRPPRALQKACVHGRDRYVRAFQVAWWNATTARDRSNQSTSSRDPAELSLKSTSRADLPNHLKTFRPTACGREISSTGPRGIGISAVHHGRARDAHLVSGRA
jgi:hypothetical protein